MYAALFGLRAGDVRTSERDGSSHQLFAWDGSGRSAGSVANTARLPEVHPHWLFFFDVPALDEAVASVRAQGGETFPPTRNWNGDELAVCHDAQGAAFGLCQPS